MTEQLEDKILSALYAFKDEILELRNIIMRIIERLYGNGQCSFHPAFVRLAIDGLICNKLDKTEEDEQLDNDIYDILSNFIKYTKKRWGSVIERDETQVQSCIKDLFSQYLQKNGNSNIEEKIFHILDPQILLKEERGKLLDSFAKLIRESCDYIHYSAELSGVVMDQELVEYRNRVYGVLGTRSMVHNA